MGYRINQKKVLFVIWGLRPGGAERVFVNIVNNIQGDIQPFVVVLGNKEGFAHELKDSLEVYYLNKKNRWDVFWLVIRLASIMREKKPDVILSFGYYANHLVVWTGHIFGIKIPICIREQTETTSSLNRANLPVIRKNLLKMTYKKADKVIAVSYKLKNSLINRYGLKRDNIKVIYNPVDLNKMTTFASEDVAHPWFHEQDIRLIVAVGRLVEAKGFSYLVDAFSFVLKTIENVRLIIIGEGDGRLILEKMIFQLGLKDKVALLGYQRNPYKFMARSDIFVLSSIYEGFPNVLLEAMACGVPVISTSCPSGPDEIINDQVNGLLVPVGSEESMAKAMIKLLRNAGLRNRFSKAGKERVKNFSLDKTIHEYDNLLNSIIK
jgi:glycosyltransferase involved in cell wall biosynthesis